MGGLGRAAVGRAGEASGRWFDVRLRIYGFTDLTPSLPALAGGLFTRNCESNCCSLSPTELNPVTTGHQHLPKFLALLIQVSPFALPTNHPRRGAELASHLDDCVLLY